MVGLGVVVVVVVVVVVGPVVVLFVVVRFVVVDGHPENGVVVLLPKGWMFGMFGFGDFGADGSGFAAFEPIFAALRNREYKGGGSARQQNQM